MENLITRFARILKHFCILKIFFPPFAPQKVDAGASTEVCLIW